MTIAARESTKLFRFKSPSADAGGSPLFIAPRLATEGTGTTGTTGAIVNFIRPHVGLDGEASDRR